VVDEKGKIAVAQYNVKAAHTTTKIKQILAAVTQTPLAYRCERLWPEAGTAYNAAPSARNRRRDQVASSKVTQKPDTEMLKALNNNITDEFRANAGKVGGRFEGNQLLLLTTKGAKSASRVSRRWWSSVSTASC
jgi:hypothetical protein